MKYHVSVKYPWCGQLLATIEFVNGEVRMMPPVYTEYFHVYFHAITCKRFEPSMDLRKYKPFEFLMQKVESIAEHIGKKEYYFLAADVKEALGYERAEITMHAFDGEATPSVTDSSIVVATFRKEKQ